jgi:hypothetical protein
MDLDPLTIPDLSPTSSAGLFSSRTQSLLRVPAPPPVPQLAPSSRPRTWTPAAAVAVDCTATVESPQVLGRWSVRRGPSMEIVIAVRWNRAWAVGAAVLAVVAALAVVATVLAVTRAP